MAKVHARGRTVLVTVTKGISDKVTRAYCSDGWMLRKFQWITAEGRLSPATWKRSAKFEVGDLRSILVTLSSEGWRTVEKHPEFDEVVGEAFMKSLK